MATATAFAPPLSATSSHVQDDQLAPNAGSEFLATAAGELALLRLLIQHRPVGLDKHWAMLSIMRQLTQSSGSTTDGDEQGGASVMSQLSSNDVWTKYRQLYNEDTLWNTWEGEQLDIIDQTSFLDDHPSLAGQGSPRPTTDTQNGKARADNAEDDSKRPPSRSHSPGSPDPTVVWTAYRFPRREFALVRSPSFLRRNPASADNEQLFASLSARVAERAELRRREAGDRDASPDYDDAQVKDFDIDVPSPRYEGEGGGEDEAQEEQEEEEDQPRGRGARHRKGPAASVKASTPSGSPAAPNHGTAIKKRAASAASTTATRPSSPKKRKTKSSNAATAADDSGSELSELDDEEEEDGEDGQGADEGGTLNGDNAQDDDEDEGEDEDNDENGGEEEDGGSDQVESRASDSEDFEEGGHGTRAKVSRNGASGGRSRGRATRSDSVPTSDAASSVVSTADAKREKARLAMRAKRAKAKEDKDKTTSEAGDGPGTRRKPGPKKKRA